MYPISGHAELLAWCALTLGHRRNEVLVRYFPDGKRGPGYRAHCEGQQGTFIVVTLDAVGVEYLTRVAAVNDQSFPIGANGNGQGFHAALALGGAIFGSVIKMYAPKAPRAVVAMAGPRGVDRKFGTAVTAFEILGRALGLLGVVVVAKTGSGHCEAPLRIS